MVLPQNLPLDTALSLPVPFQPGSSGLAAKDARSAGFLWPYVSSWKAREDELIVLAVLIKM